MKIIDGPVYAIKKRSRRPNSILAGTADGRLFVVDNGELKAVYNVCTLTDFDLQRTTKNPLETKPAIGDPDLTIGLCLPTKHGLMLVVNNYRVYYYSVTNNWRSATHDIYARNPQSSI